MEPTHHILYLFDITYIPPSFSCDDICLMLLQQEVNIMRHDYDDQSMMPMSSWYCKLKNMSKPRSQLPISTKMHTSSSAQNHPSQRKSYCFTPNGLAAFHPNNSPTKTTRIPDKESPRKSSRRSLRRRRIRSICSGRNVIRSPENENHRPRKAHGSMSVVSAGCLCRAAMESIWTKPPDQHQRPLPDSDSENEYGSDLPEYGSDHVAGSGSTFDSMLSAACACSSASSAKCKANEEKVMIHIDVNKREGRVLPNGFGFDRSGCRKSSGSCFVVVKSSRDPRGEFMQSMVEMILANDLRGSKDLEELLACYLSLNSQEYHNLIISVFKQIWFDLVIHLRRSRQM